MRESGCILCGSFDNVLVGIASWQLEDDGLFYDCECEVVKCLNCGSKFDTNCSQSLIEFLEDDED